METIPASLKSMTCTYCSIKILLPNPGPCPVGGCGGVAPHSEWVKNEGGANFKMQRFPSRQLPEETIGLKRTLSGSKL